MPIDWSILGGVAPQAQVAQPAQHTVPGQLALPTPGLIATNLDQSEWIQYDDIAKLAGSLVKQKSEHHQRIGRTISRMLRGELYAAPAPQARNQTLYQVAGEILEAFPYCSPDSIVEHFRISLERMAEETNAKFPGNPAPTCDEFRSMLVRHQGPKQGKHATITEAQEALATYSRQPNAPQGPTDLPTPTWEVANSWGPAPAGAPAAQPDGQTPVPIATPAELAGLDRRSIIVRVSDTMFLLRHPQAATYDLKVSSKSGLIIELQRRFIDAALPLELTDDEGEILTIDKICRSYAMNAHAVVYDYTATSTTFDQRSSLVRLGIQMGRLPDLRVVEPEHSDAVEFWLYTLVGGTDEAITDLYDWIAGTDQRHIDHPAAALVLQGPPSIGKSQFGRGLAMTWGSTEPVPMAVALDRFNGALTKCPIWFADEHMPEGLDQSTFRRMVQDRERNVEHKGQERVLASGCSRMVFAVNDLKDIMITANGANQDSVKATAARLAVYEACEEQSCVKAMLDIASGDQRIETMTIARHLRSIQLTETPRDQRFYGARGNNQSAKDHLMASAFYGAPLLANALAEYFTNPITWERQYNINAPAELGLRFPICVDSEIIKHHVVRKLLVCVTEMTSRAGMREQDNNNVRKALQPFVKVKVRKSIGPRDGRFRGYYLELDPDLLGGALQVDPGLLMSATTEQRRAQEGIIDV